MWCTIPREDRMAVAGLISPQIGKLLKVPLDHDEPSGIFKVQAMGRYCKNCETMSRISELGLDLELPICMEWNGIDSLMHICMDVP